MLKVLSNILCDLDPKVKAIGQKAGICDGVPSTSALVTFAKTVWIQIRPDWNSGKNVSSICDGKYAKCRTKADAHDKMGCQYISMRVYIVRSMCGSRGVRTPSPAEKSQKHRIS